MTATVFVLVAALLNSATEAPPLLTVAAGVHDRSQGANPTHFRVTQLLGQRKAGAAPRIRFEWDQLAGAPEYVLSGRWTDTQSWEVRSQEYRVTARTATRWDQGQVTFDLSLPEGNHSWQLVAVYGLNDTGDFVRPSRVSFDIR